jgi:hypothetical protein
MHKNIQAEQDTASQQQADNNVVQRQTDSPYTTKQGQQATIQAKQRPIQRKGKQTPIQAKQRPVQRKENNTGLPDNLKSGIENLSGYSMDDVKVHYNSDKPAQLKAHAYAQGTDIHVASGQERHLPHEAWHVVQQKQGRVQPTVQMKGNVNINDNPGLEREADVMGDKAVQMKEDTSSQPITTKTPSNTGQNVTQNQPIQRRLQINGTSLSANTIRNNHDGFKRSCTPILKKRGIKNITDDEWNHIFTEMEVLANTNDLYQFGGTSDLIEMLYPNNTADTVRAQMNPQEHVNTTSSSKDDFKKQKISSQGYLKEEETIYKKDGHTDPNYISRIKSNEQGQTSLKLGWGSAAHVVEINGKYFLKKLTIGGSTYAPDKKDIKGNWGGVYNEKGDGMEVSFPVTSKGGKVELSEVITFGVSTCSFSVISDEPLKNIVIMHINNDQKMPFDKIYEKSPSFRKGMNKMFVSMIDDPKEQQKILKSAAKAGVKSMDQLLRPYDINDSNRINLYTHHKVGVNFENGPQIFGDQGDSESIYKAVVKKVFMAVNKAIEDKTNFFGNLSEKNVKEIYKMLRTGLSTMDVEKIELSLQLLDWRVRLKSQQNIKESNERRTIMGVQAALKYPNSPEMQDIKQDIEKIVNSNFKKDL